MPWERHIRNQIWAVGMLLMFLLFLLTFLTSSAEGGGRETGLGVTGNNSSEGGIPEEDSDELAEMSMDEPDPSAYITAPNRLPPPKRTYKMKDQKEEEEALAAGAGGGIEESPEGVPPLSAAANGEALNFHTPLLRVPQTTGEALPGGEYGGVDRMQITRGWGRHGGFDVGGRVEVFTLDLPSVRNMVPARTGGAVSLRPSVTGANPALHGVEPGR